MIVRANSVYLVGIHIPSVMNAPSPLKVVPESTPVLDAASQEEPGKRNRKVTSLKRHFCIVLEYEPSTKVGVLLLGTTQPVQPHRFVPIADTARLDYQPPCFISFSDASQFRRGGYYNFSHALRATFVLPGEELDEQVVPPPVFCKDTLAEGGNVIDAFLNESEVKVLKKLHADYWDGVRYSKDGTPIAVPGSGGGSGTAGDTGTAGGSGPGGSGKGTTIGGLLRPINTDGTVYVPISVVRGDGFPDSAGDRLSRALDEEEERIFQLDLMEGLCKELPAPDIKCYLAPWRVQGEVFDVL